MEITKKELKKMIQEAIEEKLKLNESSFTARRIIDSVAGDASMDFEAQIIQHLDLMPPDDLRPPEQVKYLGIVEEMKQGFKDSVRAAVRKLQHFPKKESGEKTND
jgi:hypothetical protein